MNQSRTLAVMAGNVVTTGLVVVFLSFRSDPWWLWVFPSGAMVAGNWWGRRFWQDFFADRLAGLGQLGLFLGLVAGICALDPQWLGVFWLTIGGGLLGLGGALTLPGFKFQEQPELITPDPIVNYPLRVNRLLSIIFGWVIWSIPEIPLGWRAPLTILMVTVGLTGLGDWQLAIIDKKLTIDFNGIISSSYRFDLDRFQRLLLVKLQEGGIAWLQLINLKEEVTLPIILLENGTPQGEMTELLSQRYPLARQSTTKDSLQMMGILLPQGIGVFTGLSCLILSTLIWSAIQLSDSPNLTWILGGSFLVAPLLAAMLFLSIVPGSIAPQRVTTLPPWELGTLLILINLVSSPDPAPLVLATIVFLGWGIGIYALHLVRVIPIISKLE